VALKILYIVSLWGDKSGGLKCNLWKFWKQVLLDFLWLIHSFLHRMKRKEKQKRHSVSETLCFVTVSCFLQKFNCTTCKASTLLSRFCFIYNCKSSGLLQISHYNFETCAWNAFNCNVMSWTGLTLILLPSIIGTLIT